MKDTNWKGHYTGIDTREIEFLGRLFDLYLQRDTKTKKLSFVRFSISIRCIRFFKHIGIFIGRQNYGNNLIGGFQFFTNSFHFGYGREKLTKKWFGIDYDGSMVSPHSHVSFRLAKATFGFDCPKWFQVYKRRQAEKAWEKEAEAYEKAFGLDLLDDCGDGTMTNPDQER